MSDVLIKNMPLVYLKDQQEAFFTSPAFNNAKEVFDKYKTPVSGDNDLAKNEDLLLPIDLLRSLLVHIYSDEVLIIESDEERQDLLFIALSGVKPIRQELVPRKYITRSAKDITNFSGNFLVATVSDSLFIKEWNVAFQKAKENGIYQTIDSQLSSGNSSVPVKPTKTNNVIKDIVDSSKFYDSVLDTTVYDDVYYRNKALSRLVRDSVVMNMQVLPTVSLKGRLDNLYPAPIRDMQKMCDSLREKIMAKYYGQRFDFRDTNLMYNASVEETAVDKEIEGITATLSVQNGLYPLSIVRAPVIVSDPTQPVILEFTNLRKEFRHHLYSSSGVMENDLITSIKPNFDDNTIELTLSESFVGELQLMTDRHSVERINQYTLFDYFKDLSGNRMEKFDIKLSSYNTLVRLRGLNDGYFFFDLRRKDTREIVWPNKITVTDEGITLDLSNIGTACEIVILPTSAVLGGINKVKVTESTIKDVLGNINFFDKEIRVWVGARLNDR